MPGWPFKLAANQDPERARELSSKEGFTGHPTASGGRDVNIERVGDPNALDGTPGLPRLHMGPLTHRDGIPGPTPSGPIQEDVIYNDGEDLAAPIYGPQNW